MKKVSLEGLDIAIKQLNKTLLITRTDDFTKKYINKDAEINIEILKDGRVVNGTTTENLIRGLIVCSNYYLPYNAEQEKIKKARTQLENLVREGAVAKIKMFNTNLMQLEINVKGEDKYNYYGNGLTDLIKFVEEMNFVNLSTY